MKIIRSLPFVAGILALTAGSLVFAQSRTGSGQQITVTAIIPVMMNLTVDTSTVNFYFTQGDYTSEGTANKEVVNATTFKVASNTGWVLYVEADNRNFTYQPFDVGPSLLPDKDCSDLSVSPKNTFSYSAIGVIAREVAQGQAGGTEDAGHSIPVSYKLASTLADDPPGSYTLTLTYTLMPL